MSTPVRFDPELYTDAARPGAHRAARLTHHLESSTKAAIVMLCAAIVAIVIANSGLYPIYHDLLETPLAITFGARSLCMTLEGLINDFLMAIFFLVVGLEIKFEVTVGALQSLRSAILPILAAVGGVLVPVIIYLVFNHGTATAQGWGIPTATDIAFALGILSILGSRVPSGLRVFLSTLAIADDIIAIVVIAVFYGHAPSVSWILASLAVLAVLLMMNRRHVYTIRWYMLLGLVLWLCVYMSGIHPTIAGVLLAMTIPARSPLRPGEFSRWVNESLAEADGTFDRERPVLAQSGYVDTVDDISRMANYLTPPLSTLKKKIEPFSSFVVLPLFALANAGVRLVGVDVGTLAVQPSVIGIICGLVIGKPVGILIMSLITVRSGLSRLPDGVTWRHMLGAAVLGGVGFTMSIFVSNLAFADALLVIEAKAAILVASLIAGVVGYLILAAYARTYQDG